LPLLAINQRSRFYFIMEETHGRLLYFVNDPEYQPVKEIRQALTTNANAVLAPEFQMPEG
jgi:hypothetical protein